MSRHLLVALTCLFCLAVLALIAVLKGNYGTRDHVLLRKHIVSNGLSAHLSTSHKQMRKRPIELCSGLFWFHAPKTGSTLCMALQHICNPSVFERHVYNITTADIIANERSKLPKENRSFHYRFDHGSISFVRGTTTIRSSVKINIDHYPYPIMNKDHAYFFVGMLRDPKSRLVSSFLDGMHHEGMPEAEFRAMQRRWSLQPNPNGKGMDLVNKVKHATEYANHPNMIGCYVKMLNGYMCSSSTIFPHASALSTNGTTLINDDNLLPIPQYNRSLPLNQTAIDIALYRLRSFRFVGLFHHFNTSIRLLHRIMNNSSTLPSPVELFPQRTTNHNMSVLLMRDIDFYDPYDTIIFAEAKKLFALQLLAHNMT